MSKKFKPAKNKNWRKRWLDTVKYDQDWDFDYFLDIMIKKLELIKKSLEEVDYIAKEEKEEMLEQINNTLAIGYRIKENDYTKSIDFMNENSTWEATLERVVNENRELVLEPLFKITQTGENSDSDKIFDKHSSMLEAFNELDALAENADLDLELNDDNKYYSQKTIWNSEEAEEEFKRLLDQDIQDRKDDINAFFDSFKENFENWWW